MAKGTRCMAGLEPTTVQFEESSHEVPSPPPVHSTVAAVGWGDVIVMEAAAELLLAFGSPSPALLTATVFVMVWPAVSELTEAVMHNVALPPAARFPTFHSPVAGS